MWRLRHCQQMTRPKFDVCQVLPDGRRFPDPLGLVQGRVGEVKRIRDNGFAARK